MSESTTAPENDVTAILKRISDGDTLNLPPFLIDRRNRRRPELFFKSLKQLLRVKTFVGTRPNALKTQLWTALIAILLLKYLHLKSTYNWSFSNLVALIRQQLFVYRDLLAWLNDPYQAPPALAGVHDGQLALAV